MQAAENAARIQAEEAAKALATEQRRLESELAQARSALALAQQAGKAGQDGQQEMLVKLQKDHEDDLLAKLGEAESDAQRRLSKAETAAESARAEAAEARSWRRRRLSWRSKKPRRLPWRRNSSL